MKNKLVIQNSLANLEQYENHVLLPLGCKLAVTILLLVSHVSVGQQVTRCLDLPVAFAKPLLTPAYHLSATTPVIPSVPWVVICYENDDELNQTYLNPSPNSKKVSKLNWLHRYFVIAEKGDWIRLATADKTRGSELDVRTVAVVGWINKRNVLLWTKATESPMTRVQVKGLPKPSKCLYAYRSSTSLKDSILTPNSPCYFILKERNNRYLVSTNPQIGDTPAEDIVGWIDIRYIIEWNVRLALEPNFSKNINGQISSVGKSGLIGFVDLQSVTRYCSGETISSGKLLIDRDSLTLSEMNASKDNSGRISGKFFRFPILMVDPTFWRSCITVNSKDDTKKTKLEFQQKTPSGSFEYAFFPKRVIGDTVDQLSIVLFMSQSDLEEHTKQLKVMKRALKETNDFRRKSLYNFLVSLLQRYTGNKSISKDADKLSTQDLRELMQGLKQEGSKSAMFNLIIPGQADFNIGDVKDKRKLTDEQVSSFVTKIVEKTITLENILEQGENYACSYKSSKNRYYWIPLELTF